jgi:two-component system OmpR family sensor kinase
MRWLRWILAFLPAVAGLVLAALLNGVEALANPILGIRLDVGSATLILGCLVTMAALLYVAGRTLAENQSHRQLAAAQKEAAAERRRFLQRLDHELKNPLTGIRLGLANLASEPPAAARQDALASAEAEVLRLSRLTSDLRKLADLETRPLEHEPVDAAELLEEVVAVAQEQPTAERRKLTLLLPQAPWPVPSIPGDRDLLFLALFNLLDNALKFTRAGDTVEIRAFDDGSWVVIEVADTGPGIPEDEMPRVWDELYRGRGARGVPGSGLGLALVRAIVERHGGHVAIRSRLGQGTVVRVRLPVR